MSHLLKIVYVDVVLTRNAILEVQSVFVGVQVIFGYDYLTATRYGNCDSVIVQCNDIEYDGMFSVEELKFFEIKLVHGLPPQSTNLYQMEYSTSISRVSYPVLSPLDVFFFELDFTDFIMCALELTVTT